MNLSYSALTKLRGLYLIHTDGIVLKVKKVSDKNITFTNGTKLKTIEFFQKGQASWEYANDEEIRMYEDTLKYREIRDARALLKANGFFTDNLWCVDDVKGIFQCDDDEAQEVLNDALDNEATKDQIWFAIKFHGDDMGLTRNDD